MTLLKQDIDTIRFHRRTTKNDALQCYQFRSVICVDKSGMNINGSHIISVQILTMCVVIITMETSSLESYQDFEVGFPVRTSRTGVTEYNVDQMLHSAPCPPPWNVGLICAFDCLDCEETTQVLRHCTADLSASSLAEGIRICATRLQCVGFTQFCTEKKLPHLCAQIQGTTSKSEPTEQTTKTPMEQNVTVEATTALTQNVTDCGTSNQTCMGAISNNSLSSNLTDVPGSSEDDIAASSNLHSLWLLLLLPYFLVVVPCLIHLCIKRNGSVERENPINDDEAGRLMDKALISLNNLNERKLKDENSPTIIARNSVQLRSKSPNDDKAVLVNSDNAENRESFIGMSFGEELDFIDEDCPSEYNRSLLEEDV